MTDTPRMSDLRLRLGALNNRIRDVRAEYAKLMDFEIGPLEADRRETMQMMHMLATDKA